MINKLKGVFWILFFLAVIGIFIFQIVRNIITDRILDRHSLVIRAVIINDKNYMPNQKVKPEFSYSYEFIINGKKYVGNAHDNSLIVGDSVDVEYDQFKPNINRARYPKD